MSRMIQCTGMIRAARRAALGCTSVALLAVALWADDFQGATHMVPFDEDPIGYSHATPSNVIEQLQRRLVSGAVTLRHDNTAGYLRAVLAELNIAQSSQLLVFSKTSLQRDHISPGNPRAIFFNDDVYVGFIPGAPLIELSVADPKLGGVFYTLDQTTASRPTLNRTGQCLECHASAKTMGVPGHLARSLATDAQGVVDFTQGTSQVNHRTPFPERRGGWYVTGNAGGQRDLGNRAGPVRSGGQGAEAAAPVSPANVTNLNQHFDVSRYLHGQSDIVALMVLEHQLHMHNFITRLNYETTLQLSRYGHLRYLTNTVESFLKYLLFTEEAPLTNQVTGSAEFVKDFTARGPRDRQGRSLREFDLRTRLFTYPCSYLIYSHAFDALPKLLKDQLYRRLAVILSGKDTSGTYARLGPETRRALAEILAETKTDLPPDWPAKSGAPRLDIHSKAMYVKPR